MANSVFKKNKLYITAIVINIMIACIIIILSVTIHNEIITDIIIALTAAVSLLNVLVFWKLFKHHQTECILIKKLLEEDCDNYDEILIKKENVEPWLEIKKKIQAATLTESLKTEAELHALQNQINPHFLYNTLEIIRSRALVIGNTEVAEMVEALALQFRYCINHQGELATLEQELNNVHNYLLIQQYRYGNKFKFVEEIENDSIEIMRNVLPILTLQPLIENALIHGIRPKVEGGSITLRVFASAKRLHIWIEDDGIGIKEETLSRIRSALKNNEKIEQNTDNSGTKLGIALPNVNQRIKYYFGDEYGVDISSVIDIGTTIKVTLPLKEYGE